MGPATGTSHTHVKAQGMETENLKEAGAGHEHVTSIGINASFPPCFDAAS